MLLFDCYYIIKSKSLDVKIQIFVLIFVIHYIHLLFFKRTWEFLSHIDGLNFRQIIPPQPNETLKP